MCGIAGFITERTFEAKDYIAQMIQSIDHRGPDENGYYLDENTCLVNTRLSIIDLKNGQQPFISDDKNIVVVQNGEIYNFIEIKKNLEQQGYNFKTNCDTEVILQAYIHYGTACFQKFNGMFAIAIYNKKENTLILGRDRLGVKPLYLYKKNNEILFSSEIKTFLKYPYFEKQINNQAIHNYLKFNYIPHPETIYQNVHHVKPGHFYLINTNDKTIQEKQYWKIQNEQETQLDEENIITQLDELLTDAVKIRLRSDVGIGAFLSGGLDSSLVCAIAQKNLNTKLETASIGFKDKQYDESDCAKQVAKTLGLHNTTYMLDSDITHLWEKVIWHSDQPHGDVSFIPTYALSQYVAKKYKIAFTGDGGDEAFAGYTKYFSLYNDTSLDYFDSISLIKEDTLFDKLYTSEFKLKVDYETPRQIFQKAINEVSKKDSINKALYFDTKHLFPGNNLVKPDKMAMANSLETRSPLLDYRIFEMMQSIPGVHKLKSNETKYILKKLALKYLPKDIVYRKKHMFTMPVGDWFKKTLKDYVVQIINSESLKNRNIFNPAFTKKILEQHLSNKKDYTRELRAIVGLELWFRVFEDR